MTSPSNHVVLTGRVKGLARRRYRPDGSPVLQFSLKLDDEGGERLAGPGLVQIVALERLARLDLDLFQEGRRLCVEGRLAQREWRTPEGRRRSVTEVIATDLQTEDETTSKEASSMRGESYEKTC